MAGKIILYAEDNPDDVLIFQRVFRKATLPHTLYCVDDGEAAIEWLTGGGLYSDRQRYPVPDILLLDLKMPRKGGMEVLEWVRGSEKFKVIPVLILSSSDDPTDVKRAYSLGATTYFVKSAASQDVVQYLRLLT